MEFIAEQEPSLLLTNLVLNTRLSKIRILTEIFKRKN